MVRKSMLKQGHTKRSIFDARKIVSFLGVAVLLAVLAACGGSEDQPTPTATSTKATGLPHLHQEESGEVREIQIISENTRFDPDTLSANKGEPVRFTLTNNDKDVVHNFTLKLDGGGQISIDYENGDDPISTGVLHFHESGEILFWCKYHQVLGHEGTLTVAGE